MRRALLSRSLPDTLPSSHFQILYYHLTSRYFTIIGSYVKNLGYHGFAAECVDRRIGRVDPMAGSG
jgi:hypothetical protein